jgi:hypothetical protein
VKKIAVLLIVFLILILSFSISVSGLKAWPGKHYITINKWYGPGEEAKNPVIHITNTESYGINVSVRVDTPGIKTLTNGYSIIPDVNWIKTDPEILYIPGGQSGEIEVYIDVPENLQTSRFNEKWEAYVVISPPLDSGDGFNVQTELAVKLLIKTPTGEAAGIHSIYILLSFIIIIITICLLSLFIGKKKKNASLYYFKKKK